MTQFKQRVKQDFSTAAWEYDRFATLQYWVALSLCERLREGCQDGKHKTILDLGAGTGYIAKLCKKLAIDVTVIQLDLSWEMCALARSFAVNADMEVLPFKDHAFDIVVSSMALQWAEVPERVFNEMKRVLKPGGAWHISVPGKDTLKELRDTYESCGFVPPMYAFDEIYWDTPACGDVECVSQVNKVHYVSFRELLHSIKRVGARHKTLSQRLTPRQFSHLEQYYEQHYGDEEGVVATWQIHFMSGCV